MVEQFRIQVVDADERERRNMIVLAEGYDDALSWGRDWMRAWGSTVPGQNFVGWTVLATPVE